MLVKLATDKTVTEAAAALQTAVQANHFGVMQVHNLKETLAKKGVEFARECLIFEVCQPQQAKKVLDENSYARLLITRPIVPVGNDIGFLPGDKQEKMRPWMQPIFDNVEYIFSNAQETKGLRFGLPGLGRSSKDCDEERTKSLRVVEYLQDRGILEMEPLTYIRGRSIPRQFIICDEAQNLSPQMIKTIVTRIGEGSKVIFTGDPEQIDHPYLDASSNGLTYFVERFKDQEIAGHVTLCKGERSALAELGSMIL